MCESRNWKDYSTRSMPYSPVHAYRHKRLLAIELYQFQPFIRHAMFRLFDREKKLRINGL
jgi:hypothetical protein